MKYSINLSFLVILTAVSYGCGKVPIPVPGQPGIHFVGDFENDNFNGFHFLMADQPFNAVIVSKPVRKGKYALRNTLRPDDFSNNGYRAEMAVYNCATYQTEYYYGLSIYIDSNYTDQAYNLLCQWQDLPDYLQGENWDPSPVLHGSSPPVQMTYVNGTLELKMNENPNTDNQTFIVGNPILINKGQWYDLVFHIYWSDDDSGYVEAWLNGNHITPFNGSDYKYYKSNLFTRDGNYFKFGQYRGKNKTANTNVVFFDEIKIGTSYNEVAP